MDNPMEHQNNKIRETAGQAGAGRPLTEEEAMALVSPQQKSFGLVVHWVTIMTTLIALAAPVFILWRPERNVADPYRVFSAVFAGKSKGDIWAAAGTEFPGGHFYLEGIFRGDALAQAGLAIGCSVALWALLPAIWKYFKARDYLYAGISLFIALLIALAMTGVLAFDA